MQLNEKIKKHEGFHDQKTIERYYKVDPVNKLYNLLYSLLGYTHMD